MSDTLPGATPAKPTPRPSIFDIENTERVDPIADIRGQASQSQPGRVPAVVDAYRASTEAMISKLGAQSDDPVEFMGRWEAAKSMHAFYPEVNATTIFTNYEAFAADYWGKAPVPTKSAFQVLKDNLEASTIGAGRAFIAAAHSMQVIADNLTLGKVIPRSVMENDLKVMQDMGARMAELTTDNAPQGALKWWARVIGGTLPESMIMAGVYAGSAALTGGASVAGEATAGLMKLVPFAGRMVPKVAALQAIAANSSKHLASSVVWAQLQGYDYLAIRDSLKGYKGNVDDIAIPISVLTGGVNMMLQDALGLERQFGKLFDKTMTAGVSDEIINWLHASGSLRSLSTTFAARYGINIAAQSFEEALQSASTDVGGFIAQGVATKLAGANILEEPLQLAKVAQHFTDSLIMGGAAAIVLGIPATVVGSISDKRKAVELSAAMPGMTEETAIKAFASLDMPGMTEEAKRAMGKTVYDAQMKRAAEEKAQADDMLAKATAKPTEGQGKAERKAGGALDIKSEVTSEDGDSQEITYYAQSQSANKNGKADIYHQLDTTVTPGKVIINAGEHMDEHRGLADELIGEVMAQNPGKIIELGPQAEADPLIMGAVDRYLKKKEFFDTSDNPVDESAKNMMRNQIASVGDFSPGQIEAQIDLLQIGANNSGQTFAEYTNNLDIMQGTSEQIGGEQYAGTLRLFDNGQEVSAEDVKKMNSAIVFLAEGSNAAVLTHELVHFSRVQMSLKNPSALKAIEAAYGVENGKWTVEHDERLARELPNFMVHNTVSDERVRPFLEEMKAMLKELWRGAMQKLALSPDVEKVFTEWMSAPKVDSAPPAEAELSRNLDAMESDVDLASNANLAVSEIEDMGPTDAKDMLEELDSEEFDTVDDFLNYLDDEFAAREAELEKRLEGLHMLSDDLIYKTDEIVDKKIKGPMPGEQVLKTLRGAGVKEDELKWTGLEDFLVSKEGKVSPQEIREYLAANHLNIEAVEKISGQGTKFGHGDEYNFALPGGTNYREIMYTLPGPDMGYDIGLYHGIHGYGDKADHNRFAHARVSDRVGPNGEAILYIDEIQSDWHQDGGRRGYRDHDYTPEPVIDYFQLSNDLQDRARAMINDIYERVASAHPDVMTLEEYREYMRTRTVRGPSAQDNAIFESLAPKMIELSLIYDAEITPEQLSAIQVLIDQSQTMRFSRPEVSTEKEPVSDAPFKKTWHEFVLKALMREAIDKGYDGVAVSTGDIQSKRYNGHGTEDLKKRYDEKYANYLAKIGKLFGKEPVKIDIVHDSNSGGDFSNIRDAITPLNRVMLRRSDERGTPYEYEIIDKDGYTVLAHGVGSIGAIVNMFRSSEVINALDHLQSHPGEYSVETSVGESEEIRDLLGLLQVFEVNYLPLDGITNEAHNALKYLFMTKDDLVSRGEDLNKEASQDARDYESVQEWVEHLDRGWKWEGLSRSDQAWYQERYEYNRSNAPKMFPNKGDFAKMLLSGRNLSDFLNAISRAVHGGAKGAIEMNRRAQRVRDSISSNADLMKAVSRMEETGQMPTEATMKRLGTFFRTNESTMKFLYAEVSGDKTLANEALSEIKEVPEVDKADFIQRPGITLADQKMIIKTIQDDALRAKLMSGEATVNDILKYESLLRNKGNKALTKVANLAVDTATKVTADKYKERIALTRMKQEMRKQQKYILSQPSAKLDNNSLHTLLLMKQYIKNGQAKDMSSLKALSSIVFHRDPQHALDIFGFIDSIQKKDFNDWSLDELRRVARFMLETHKLGRANFDLEKYFYKDRIMGTRNTILRALQKSDRYQEPPEAGSVEEADIEKRNKLRETLTMGWYSAARATALFKDVDKSGALNKFLSTDAQIAKSKSYEEKDRRTKAVLKFIKDKKISKRLFDEVIVKRVGQNGGNVTLRRVDLLGARALMGRGENFNEHQRERVINSIGFTDTFKDSTPRWETEDGNSEIDEIMRDQFEGKVAAMEAAFNEHISPDEETMVQMMVESFADPDDKVRFINAMLKISGREITMEDYYFQIRQKGGLVRGDDEIVDATVDSGGMPKAMIEDGFTIDRQRKIAPHRQKAINLDLMELYFGGIERQEHLINLGMWGKDVMSIFQSKEDSSGLQRTLKTIAGSNFNDYIANYIDSVVNPNGFHQRGDGSEMLKTFRGKLMSNMLALRASTILIQGWTSPMITIAYAPEKYLSTVTKAWFSGNPMKWVQGIEEKSSILRNRQLDPYLAHLKQLEEQGMIRGLTRISEEGFKALSFIDRISVAVSWESIYQHNVDSGKSHEESVIEADRIILDTQPTSEDMFRSPLYKNMDSFKGVLLQFTQPLNVIWNNIRYDVPEAWANDQKMKAVGIMACYAMAGLGIGAIKAAIGATQGTGPASEDDEEGKWERYFASYLFSQYTDSIPIVGNAVSQTLRSLITGKPFFQSQLGGSIPLAESMVDLTKDVKSLIENGDDATRKQWLAFFGDGLMMIGLLTGAPGLALKNFLQTLDTIAGASEE